MKQNNKNPTSKRKRFAMTFVTFSLLISMLGITCFATGAGTLPNEVYTAAHNGYTLTITNFTWYESYNFGNDIYTPEGESSRGRYDISITPSSSPNSGSWSLMNYYYRVDDLSVGNVYKTESYALSPGKDTDLKYNGFVPYRSNSGLGTYIWKFDSLVDVEISCDYYKIVDGQYRKYDFYSSKEQVSFAYLFDGISVDSQSEIVYIDNLEIVIYNVQEAQWLEVWSPICEAGDTELDISRLYTSGSEMNQTPLTWLLDTVEGILDARLFGPKEHPFTIGGALSIFVGIIGIIALLKLFAGG